VLAAVALAVSATAAAPSPARVPVIIDTDFVAKAPSDDALAVLLALQSPELDVLAITTVAGNDSLERATSDALRVLEIAGRPEVPVYAGADMPLLHEANAWERSGYGRWWSDDPPPPPPGGFATKKAEPGSAADYLVRAVRQRPRELTIVAIGPLTNLAIALRSDPAFARNVKQLVIMGGAIAALPDGAGNMTPNAEYNFWVDPEAARAVLRSGIQVQLSPLNVSRKTNLTRAVYERMVATETPLTGLLRFILGTVFEKEPTRRVSMFDEVAVAAVIDPTLVKTRSMYVDVDATHGINYGVSVGGDEPWPGAEGAQRMDVQYDLDWERFADLMVRRVGSGR
jgi:inosine-uridine nucleoside N-ribohydrolase